MRRHSFDATLLAAALFLWPATTRLHAADGAARHLIVDRAPPTVVFESGLGESGASWDAIAPEVAAFAGVFAYDRPGYGAAPAVPPDKDGLRDSDDAAETLRALLAEEGVSGPFVLVGHSIGGGYALRFAALHPEEVLGVVLVDGRPKDFAALCEAAGGGCTGPALTDETPAHIAAEARGVAATDAKIPDPEDLGDIPVSLLVRAPGEGPRAAAWQESQALYAKGLANGRLTVVEGAGHYIHIDQPAIVIAEIRRVVEEARRAR